MPRCRHMAAILVALAVIAVARPGAALTIGQTDTFQDGTTNNWFAGGGPLGQFPPVPPANVATGGPAGAGDAFLQIVGIGGNGPGSRLVGINAAQWAGDYVAAGIDTIRMDAINLGPADLSLRLMFLEIDATLLSLAISTDAITLLAGAGWQTIEFAIAPADLTAVQGSALDALANASELRLVHSTTATNPPTPVTGTLGVDNIIALGEAVPQPVPEPGSLALLGSALAAIAVVILIRKRRRK
jgi:hypothetical protein